MGGSKASCQMALGLKGSDAPVQSWVGFLTSGSLIFKMGQYHPPCRGSSPPLVGASFLAPVSPTHYHVVGTSAHVSQPGAPERLPAL